MSEIHLTDENFSREVLEYKGVALVDFWAPWCGPCRMMAPILDELSSELAGKIKIAKVNTEEAINQDLAIKYEIQSIPNMKLFKNGEVIGEFIGMRNKDSLKADLTASL